MVAGQELVGHPLLVPVRYALALRLLYVLGVGSGRLVRLTRPLVEAGQLQQGNTTLYVTHTVRLPETFHRVLGQGNHVSNNGVCGTTSLHKYENRIPSVSNLDPDPQGSAL